jgi:hypothetical protein
MYFLSLSQDKVNSIFVRRISVKMNDGPGIRNVTNRLSLNFLSEYIMEIIII